MYTWQPKPPPVEDVLEHLRPEWGMADRDGSKTSYDVLIANLRFYKFCKLESLLSIDEIHYLAFTVNIID